MSSAKVAAALVGICAAMSLAACGSAIKPATGSRGRVDDPRTTKHNHVKCLQANRLPVQEVGATALQIGPLPAGPTVKFMPTPGIAQGVQIQGRYPGAEVIGNALLFPNKASDTELKVIETCLATGVSG